MDLSSESSSVTPILSHHASPFARMQRYRYRETEERREAEFSDLRHVEYPSNCSGKKVKKQIFRTFSTALREIIILSDIGEQEVILRIILHFYRIYHF